MWNDHDYRIMELLNFMSLPQKCTIPVTPHYTLTISFAVKISALTADIDRTYTSISGFNFNNINPLRFEKSKPFKFFYKTQVIP